MTEEVLHSGWQLLHSLDNLVNSIGCLEHFAYDWRILCHASDDSHDVTVRAGKLIQEGIFTAACGLLERLARLTYLAYDGCSGVQLGGYRVQDTGALWLWRIALGKGLAVRSVHIHLGLSFGFGPLHLFLRARLGLRRLYLLLARSCFSRQLFLMLRSLHRLLLLLRRSLLCRPLGRRLLGR